VPTEPAKVESKTLGCRADEVLEIGAVIERVSALLKNIPVSLSIGRLVAAVCLNQACQRELLACTFGFWFVRISPIVALCNRDQTAVKVNPSPICSVATKVMLLAVIPDAPWVYDLGKRPGRTGAVGDAVAVLLNWRVYGALQVEIYGRMAVPEAFVFGGSPTGIGRRT
jgi:hypothetical protein